MLECRGPLPSAIAPLSVLQTECITGLDALQGIAAIFPVDKVFRLHDGGTREDVHGGGHHIVCIAYTTNIGVGEIAENNGVGEGSVSPVGHGCTCECLAWIVTLGILLEPMVHGPRAGFRVVEEGILAILGRFVLEGGKVLGRGKQYPADIAGIVGDLLEVGAEVFITCHTRMCLAPGGIVLLVGPVHLGYHYRREVGNGLHILLPSSCKSLIPVSATEPAGIDVHGIAYVLSLDRIGGITCILGLEAQAWNPQYVVASLCTHGIHYLLEVDAQLFKLCHGTSAIGAVATKDTDGFVGQLEHDVEVVLQLGMACHVAPHLQQELLIVIAYGNLLWTYPGRAHHHIHAFTDGILRHGDKDLVEIPGEPVETEG